MRQRRSGPLQAGLFELEEDLYAQERGAWARGLWVAGVDEVGRGPLAGPVVAAAVILDPTAPVDGLRDSKLLTARQRRRLAREIRVRALAFAVGRVGPRRIDTVNVLQATWCAMRAALERLRLAPGLVLVDGNLRIPGVTCAQRAIIAGDRRSASVAAASILAKVARDCLHAARRPALSRVRLPAAQGVRDRRAPRGARAARPVPAPPALLSWSWPWRRGRRRRRARLATPPSSFGSSDVSPAALERPLVPRFLLAGFADATGQLIAERRDRTRRRLVLVDAAVAELGGMRSRPTGADAPALARLLAEVEARGAEAVQRITAGAFPPRESDRASLALVLAAQLLLGRYHRAEAGRVATLVGQLIVSTIEEAEEEEEEAEVAEEASEEADVDEPERGRSAAAGPGGTQAGRQPAARARRTCCSRAGRRSAARWRRCRRSRVSWRPARGRSSAFRRRCS